VPGKACRMPRECERIAEVPLLLSVRILAAAARFRATMVLVPQARASAGDSPRAS
jgi:hypothetical protein